MQDAYYDEIAGELVIPLANGGEIRSGWIDRDDPDALPAGDYLKVLNPAKEEVFYEDSADILADPVAGRRKLWAMLQACSTTLPSDSV